MQVSPIRCFFMTRIHLVFREFDPSWKSVAKAWSKVSPSDRDSHFFATLDFDSAQALFQKVIHYLPNASFQLTQNN
jgi:OST3 / OST6 family, transporter family